MIFGRKRSKEVEAAEEARKLNMKLKADHSKVMKQMEDLMASMKKSTMAKEKTAPDFDVRKGRATIRGKPHGRILHKMMGYTSSYFSMCDRYLVVQPDLWLELDAAGEIIGHAEDVDPFGQVHWEDNCPKTKRPR